MTAIQGAAMFRRKVELRKKFMRSPINIVRVMQLSGCRDDSVSTTSSQQCRKDDRSQSTFVSVIPVRALSAGI
jgi:hypothetical protein